MGVVFHLIFMDYPVLGSSSPVTSIPPLFLFFFLSSQVPNYFKCNKPKAQPALSAFYWIFFIMVCSWVMLALFVGAITIAMSETMDEGDDDDDAEAERRPTATKLRRRRTSWPRP